LESRRVFLSPSSAILLHLDLPHRPPPLSPARGPPEDPQADFAFDQSVPDRWDLMPEEPADTTEPAGD